MKSLWLFETSFLIFAICCLGLALRGIFTRRPIIFSFLWLMVIFVLLLVPLILNTLLLVASLNKFDFGALLSPLLMVVVFAMVFRNLRGYTVLGVSDNYLKDALNTALQRLELPFEESLSRIRLSSLDADLLVGMQSRMGAAQLSIKPAGHGKTLKQIVQAMRDYFATVPGKTNISAYVYYGLFGILMLATTIYFYTLPKP